MMDHLIYNNTALHVILLKNFRRTLSTSTPIDNFGYFPAKNYAIDGSVPSTLFSISFIMEGSGFFELDGIRREVTEPFFFIELPKRHYHYAPHTTWKQYYFDYYSSPADFLDRWHIMPSDHLCWPIAMPQSVLRRLDDIVSLAEGEIAGSGVDRIDMLVDLAIVEALGSNTSQAGSVNDSKILQAQRYIRANYRKTLSVEDICRQFGFSRAGFHRCWKHKFQNSPLEMITDLRLQSALLNLTNTRMSIKEVSAYVGFPDQNYFSRLFRKAFGTTPSEFRAHPRQIQS